MVAIDGTRQSECLDYKCLCFLRRVFKQQSHEHASGLEDSGVRRAGAVSESIFVNLFGAIKLIRKRSAYFVGGMVLQSGCRRAL